MQPPPGRLEGFAGWPDPPWRANTSISLLVPDPACPERVGSHLLLDCGFGVAESLTAVAIPGSERIAAVLLTHWHSDHVAGERLIGEGVRRTLGHAFAPIPLFGHPYTLERVQAAFSRDMERLYDIQPSEPGFPINIGEFTILPVQVQHHDNQGCVIYLVTHRASGTRMIFAWDLDTPQTQLPDGVTCNLDVFADPALHGADLLLLECNTWQVSRRWERFRWHTTGHSCFLAGWSYVEACRPRRLGLVHLSGHEDGDGSPGHGWTDDEWIDAAWRHAAAHPVGGRQVEVLRLLQGTVLHPAAPDEPGREAQQRRWSPALLPRAARERSSAAAGSPH